MKKIDQSVATPAEQPAATEPNVEIPATQPPVTVPELARTGFDGGLAGVGLALVVCGAALVRCARRLAV